MNDMENIERGIRRYAAMLDGQKVAVMYHTNSAGYVVNNYINDKCRWFKSFDAAMRSLRKRTMDYVETYEV